MTQGEELNWWKQRQANMSAAERGKEKAWRAKRAEEELKAQAKRERSLAQQRAERQREEREQRKREREAEREEGEDLASYLAYCEEVWHDTQ